jgi:hypothetical protein
METHAIRDCKVERPVRLRIEKGVVFLRSRGLPSVACPLLDLSENGCRCLVPLDKLEPAVAERWRSKLEMGHQMSVDVSAPPYLPGLHLDIEIKHVAPVEGGLAELGLEFRNVESDERTILNKALVAFATRKLDSTQTSPNGTPINVNGAKPGDIGPNGASHVNGSNGSGLQAAIVPSKPGPTDSQTMRIVKNWFAPPEMPPAPEPRIENPMPSPAENDPYRGKRLGEILVALGKVSNDEVLTACKATLSVGEQMGRYLLRSGCITPIELCSALSLQTGLPITDLSGVQVPPEVSSTFSYLTMLKHQMVPFETTDQSISVASTHPLPPTLISELQQRCKKTIRVFLAEDDLVVKLLHSLQPAKERKLRKHARVKLNVPATIQFVNRQMETAGDVVYHGKTIDISERGLMIAAPEDLRRRGACLKVSFELAPQTVTAWCSMRYVREPQSAEPGCDQWTFGLQILDISEENQKNLKEICLRIKMWNMQDVRMKRRA